MILQEEIGKRILTVSPDYRNHRGGIGAVVASYNAHFASFAHVATYPSEKTRNGFVALPFYFLSLFRLFLTLLFNRSIKIVHIHSAAKGSFLRKYGVFIISKYLFGKKVIFHSHGSELKDFYNSRKGVIRKIFRHFMNKVDVIICLSPQWKEFFSTHFLPRKVVVLENIIERPADIRRSRPAMPGRVSFLFLGQIGNRKGIFDLIDVIRDHIDLWRGKATFVVGGNGETGKLQQLITTYGLADTVIFKGWVSGEQKAELLRDCDVYLLPSYNEGLPLSVLEAMSYGKPVISTTVGGIPEVVKNDLNGYLIRPGDQPDLFRRIDTFVQAPGAIDGMGKASLQIVEPYYPDHVIAKLEQIYIELLNK